MVGPRSPQAPSLVGVFLRHPNAPNLLAAIMVLMGLFALSQLNRQFFPTLEVPVITVSVVWPGASAEDVEANILEALEPELRFLDGLDEIKSTSREGSASVTMEFTSDANMDKALSDVESAVGRLTTLPKDIERPVITRVAFYEGVASVVVSGPFSEATLKSHARRLRDGLLEAGIDRVNFTGARDEEIVVRVLPGELRRHDLTVAGISERIAALSQDLPSGTLEGSVDRQLRSVSEAETPDAVARVEVKAGAGGERILVRDIAVVEQAFDEDAAEGRRNGHRAIRLDVQRALGADTLDVAARLDRYLAEVVPTLPRGLDVHKYDVRSERVNQRIALLLKNGLGGMVLVLVVLFVFLNGRVAFWVAAGIPVALMATLAVMWASGQSINMISLFALILTLGIIVDDAIVVGEHTATRFAAGDSPVEAAERGAGRMFVPVIASMLTTMVAFMPLLLVTGRIGDVVVALPLVVIAVLVASLVECFLILPGHLNHALTAARRPPPPLLGWLYRGFGRFRSGFDSRFYAFRDGPFSRFATLCYRWRYTTIAAAIGLLIVSVGLVAGGRVKFQFFPTPEPELVTASLLMGAGTPRERTNEVMQEIEAALDRAEAGLARDGEKLVRTRFAVIGSDGDNGASLTVELAPAEERTVRTRDVISAWRKAVPPMPGVDRVTITGRRAGPPGRDLDIKLLDAEPARLKAAALELRTLLSAFPGVSSVADDLPYGKQEIVIEPTARGLALGFTTESIARQVRNTFEGAIARRFARGDEEITVRVKEQGKRGGYVALRDLYLTTPAGSRVALSEIATLRERTGFSIIRREQGKTAVSVTADVDSSVTQASGILSELERGSLQEIAAKHGVGYRFSGREEERRESFRDLQLGLGLALLLIYIILAWVFGSYLKPVVVMLIIPFGIIGAILGHMAMGFALTILSLFALLGLTGILVNDSIILVSRITERLEAGESAEEAAVGGARDRLRAVMLTSLTTIGGLIPMMFEKSLQAQFLLPMAITLVFGLAVATLLVLILVPATLGVFADVAGLARRYVRWATYGPRRRA